MMWVICTKVEGEDQELTGPFGGYADAMAVFVEMPPASAFEWKYCREVFTVGERRRISGGDDRADLERVEPEWREALMGELIDEVGDMSSKELAFLLLEGMDMAELNERVRELKRDFPDSAVRHH